MTDLHEKMLSFGLSCFIGTFIIFDFYNNMFHLKAMKKIHLYTYKIVFVIVWFCINLLRIPFLNLTFFIIACLFTACFLYKVKHIKEFFQIVTFIVCFSGCDATVSSIFSIFTKKVIPYYGSDPILFLLNVISIEAIMIAVSKTLILFLKDRGLNTLHKKQILFLSIFPALNIVVFYIISLLNYRWSTAENSLIILLMAMTSTLLNLAVIYFFEYVSKSNELEKEISLMQQQMDMQYNYYKQLEFEYDETHSIMHDIKNHLEVINNLNKEDSQAGSVYTNKIYSLIDDYSLKFKTNNRLLNIIVNDKIKECNRKNIKFIYSVENTDLYFLDDIDSTSLFANLLDNAIEACSKIENLKKYIEFRIYRFNNMIIINLINSINLQPKKDNGVFISGKKNHKAIGLSNVKKVVEKYGGDINIDVEQNTFSVSILFPVPSN